MRALCYSISLAASAVKRKCNGGSSLRGTPEPDQMVQASTRHLRDYHERWTMQATLVRYSALFTLSPHFQRV